MRNDPKRGAMNDSQKPAEVWSDAIPPGGYVCAVPSPNLPDGICGMPVEDEPCSIHNPLADAGLEADLAELESTDPDVGAAAKRLEETKARILARAARSELAPRRPE